MEVAIILEDWYLPQSMPFGRQFLDYALVVYFVLLAWYCLGEVSRIVVGRISDQDCLTFYCHDHYSEHLHFSLPKQRIWNKMKKVHTVGKVPNRRKIDDSSTHVRIHIFPMVVQPRNAPFPLTLKDAIMRQWFQHGSKYTLNIDS